MTRKVAIRIATGLRTNFKCESDTMVDFCNTIIKALEQEPCEDAISKAEVIKLIGKHTNDDGTLDDDITCILEELPPIQPKSKVGKWIEDDEEMEVYCSVCSEVLDTNYCTNYCPNCGAKMESEE